MALLAERAAHDRLRGLREIDRLIDAQQLLERGASRGIGAVVRESVQAERTAGRDHQGLRRRTGDEQVVATGRDHRRYARVDVERGQLRPTAGRPIRCSTTRYSRSTPATDAADRCAKTGSPASPWSSTDTVPWSAAAPACRRSPRRRDCRTPTATAGPAAPDAARRAAQPPATANGNSCDLRQREITARLRVIRVARRVQRHDRVVGVVAAVQEYAHQCLVVARRGGMGGEDAELTQGRGTRERTGVLQKASTFHISAPLGIARKSGSDNWPRAPRRADRSKLAATELAAARMMLLASLGRLPCISV